MLVKVGTYTGNGADSRSITGVGFQPDVVLIKGAGSTELVMRTSTMSGDLTDDMGTTSTAFQANRVQALEADGFQIGTDARVNSDTIVYYYVALKDDGSGDLKVSTYTGDGTDNRSITGVGFQPTAVIFAPEGASTSGWNFAGADATSRVDTTAANLIQAFESDGFQVGSGTANTNLNIIHYVAIKNTSGVSKVSTYVGNATDSRSITGIGFQPDFAFVQKVSAAFHQVGVVRFKDNSGDSSALLNNTAFAANHIQAMESDGFQIGDSVNVNTNTANYSYLVFKDRAAAGTTTSTSTSTTTTSTSTSSSTTTSTTSTSSSTSTSTTSTSSSTTSSTSTTTTSTSTSSSTTTSTTSTSSSTSTTSTSSSSSTSTTSSTSTSTTSTSSSTSTTVTTSTSTSSSSSTTTTTSTSSSSSTSSSTTTTWPYSFSVEFM